MQRKTIQQLLVTTATLALLGGGVPVGLVNGHAATATVTARAATKNTYSVDRVQLPGIKAWRDGQPTIYLNPEFSGLPQTVTASQAADPAYLAGLTYPAGLTAADLTAFLQPYFDQAFQVDADQTYAEFLYSVHSDDYQSVAALTQDLTVSTYLQAWVVSRVQRYLEGTYTAADFVKDYPATLQTQLVKAEGSDYEEYFQEYEKTYSYADDPDKLAARFTTQFQANSQGNQNTVAAILGLTGHGLDLTTANPAKSQAAMERQLAEPATQAVVAVDEQGTVTVDTSYVAPYVVVLGDTDPLYPETPTEPETPTNPDKPTVPTTQTGTVTVHYQDEQGKALAPTKTLTGKAGDRYTTTALDLDGYVLMKTTGAAAGTFTATAQTVTYVYAPLTTGGADATVAKKGSVVLATQKIGLYRDKTLAAAKRIQWYQKKARINRPMFVVTGYARSQTGKLRYQVKDVNHRSRTAGQVGYITAKSAYVTPAYYASRQKTVTVINPAGVNAYRQKNLTHKTAHYRQGQVLTVKRIERHNLTTRFVLSNGRYITANKQLVQAGKVTAAKTVQMKRGVHRYATVNLTTRNGHFVKGQKVRVLGWDYTHAATFNKADTLRYRVAGGYITAAAKDVRIIR